MRSPRRWVYSIKAGPPPDADGPFGRSRSYWESAELGVGAEWGAGSEPKRVVHTGEGSHLTLVHSFLFLRRWFVLVLYSNHF